MNTTRATESAGRPAYSVQTTLRANRPLLAHIHILLACILLPVSAIASNAPAQDSPSSLFTAANTHFNAALRAHDQLPGSGLTDFLTAADLYNQLITTHHINNHTLHANRGSALLLAGDTGRAIAAFRRAQRLDPADPAIRDALATARARVGAAITPAPSSRIRNIALAWRGHIPRPALLALALTAYAAAWLALTARLLGFHPGSRIAFIAAAVSVFSIAPLIAESVLDAPRDHGVLIASGVPALNGPSPGVYAPTFTTPLPAGLELRILERRDNYIHVRLPDNRDTWLPADALEPL